MSGDTSAFGFGKFIPGFEFLQGLAQGAGAAASPLGRVPQWVAPTVSVEEVDKRIAELKAVQFWLEQNGRALAATIQALEVQRMTLSTLQGMNVSMSDLAKNFPFPGGQAAASASAYTGWPMGAGSSRHEEPVSEPAAAPVPQPEPQAEAAKPEADASEAATSAQQQSQAALGQAMQWWGALTQQFQQIAAKAMAEPVPAETMAAAQRATEAASSFAKSAMDKVMEQAGTFTPGAKAAAKPKPAAEASAATAKAGAARKPAAKKAVAQKPATKAAAAPAARKRAAAPRKS